MTIKATDSSPNTALTQQSTIQPLSFPAEIFAKLSPAPYLLAHLNPSDSFIPSTRPSGRNPSEFRPPNFHSGSLTHASGSAVLRVGDTAVVCGVRAETLLASDVPDSRQLRDGRKIAGTGPSETRRDQRSRQLADLNLVVPNLELATGCSPAHLPGSPPSVLAQTLSQRLLTLLHTSKVLDIDDLKIYHYPLPLEVKDKTDAAEAEDDARPIVKAFWVLYISIHVLSLDGPVFDTAWAAMLLALRGTVLPRAWWDADKGVILCDDAVTKARKLQVRGWPVASTFAVFEKPRGRGQVVQGQGGGEEYWVLADPDDGEENVCAEFITVVVDSSQEGQRRGNGNGKNRDSAPEGRSIKGGRTRLLKIEKNGGGVVGVSEVRKMVVLAEKRWREWMSVIEAGPLG